MYRLLLTVGLWGLFMSALAQADQASPTEIADLKKDWLTYDGKSNSYTPFIVGSLLDHPYIGFYLSVDDYAGMQLHCCAPRGTGMYIDNSLVSYYSQSDCMGFDIDSLKQIYPKPQIFVNLYRRGFNSPQFTTSIVIPAPMVASVAESDDTMMLLKRESIFFPNFIVIGLLILMAYYAALLNLYPKTFKEFFNLNKAFALKLKEEKILTPSVFTRTNLLFFLGYGMVVSFVSIIFWFFLGGIPLLFSFVDLGTMTATFFSWIKLSFMAMIVLCLKYLLIVSLGSLFNHRLVAPRHFYDFTRLSHIFLLLIFVLVVMAYLILESPPEVLYRILFYGFALLLVLRVVILSLKLLDSGSFRNFHLFSYLCTTEILPLIIGVKIFL